MKTFADLLSAPVDLRERILAMEANPPAGMESREAICEWLLESHGYQLTPHELGSFWRQEHEACFWRAAFDKIASSRREIARLMETMGDTELVSIAFRKALVAAVATDDSELMMRGVEIYLKEQRLRDDRKTKAELGLEELVAELGGPGTAPELMMKRLAERIQRR